LKDFNGVIPRTVEELKTIDGIGQYTAGAISSIAFNKVEPLVDGNVIRVLSRLYALKESVGQCSATSSYCAMQDMKSPAGPSNYFVFRNRLESDGKS
jgi:A/G-specific adenine glycosylase